MDSDEFDYCSEWALDFSCSSSSRRTTPTQSPPSRYDVLCQITGVDPLRRRPQQRREKKKVKTGLLYCVFCKNNEEIPEVYLSHMLKDDYGRTVCPVLFNYICPICGATGEEAHTVKHCPWNRENQTKMRELSIQWAKLLEVKKRQQQQQLSQEIFRQEDDDPLRPLEEFIVDRDTFATNLKRLCILQQYNYHE